MTSISLITGASGGIGRALARQLHAQGCRVVGAQRGGHTYAAQGLRIDAVAPGMTDTPMTAGMLKLPAMRECAARQGEVTGRSST